MSMKIGRPLFLVQTLVLVLESLYSVLISEVGENVNLFFKFYAKVAHLINILSSSGFVVFLL